MGSSSDRLSSGEVTLLLKAWSGGERAALDKLTPLVERELHRLAHKFMAQENPGHTLQTTALVNEVYLRLGHVADKTCSHPNPVEGNPEIWPQRGEPDLTQKKRGSHDPCQPPIPLSKMRGITNHGSPRAQFEEKSK